MKLVKPYLRLLIAGIAGVGICTGQTVLWSSDFETGNSSEWYAPSTGPYGSYGGGEYNSGSASTQVTRERARSGAHSLKMSISTPPESGARMFRWLEPRANTRLNYSVWMNFPQRYTVRNYWNVFQWKSKRGSNQNDPFFVLNVGNRPDGTMYFYLYNWQQRRAYQQSVKNIAVNQWTEIRAYYQCAGDGTGRVTFWQDGVLLFDVPNVSTRYADGDCQWSVDNYSDGLSPASASIYVDDAQITSGSGGSGSSTSAPRVSGGSLAAASAGVAYSATLQASSGTAPYSWVLSSGQLPPGLSLASDGRVHGVPTTVGSYSFSATVRDAAGYSAQGSFTIGVTAPVTALWTSDFETGDKGQWYAGSGGGETVSGAAWSQVTTEEAASGRFSLKMNITTPSESGVQMFRVSPANAGSSLKYSVKFNFPKRYSVPNYWNVLEWRSQRSNGQSNPFFILNVGNRSDGSMYFYLYDWQNRRSYTQNVKNIPVGAWTKIEAQYVSAGDRTGRVRITQDGTLLFDIPNVTTRYADGDTRWSVNSYSDRVTPSPTVIFVDDAQITR